VGVAGVGVDERADLGAVAAPDRPGPVGVLVAFAALAAAVAATRVWQLSGRQPLWWNDSEDFLASSRLGLFGLERWAGTRTVAAPIVLWLAGGDPDRYVFWQAVVATVCWSALAASVWTVVPGRRARWAAALAVVAFSCTVPVVMWERSVLSEGLAAASLALVVAAGLQLARGVTSWRVTAVLAAVVVWLTVRDSHASVVLVAAVALGAAVVWRRGRLRRTGPLVGLACGLLVAGVLATVATLHGDRYAYPLRNVFEARVLPYPDRVAWFADHGMPQADRFAGPGALTPYREEGQAPVVFVADEDPTLQPWLEWVERDGRGAFATWLATHPAYVLAEPLHDPERTFNNARGDRSFYAPADLREVPLVTEVLMPSRALAIVVAAALAGWAARRGRWRSPLVLAGAAAVALAVPHALVSWHSDGMETARHLVVPVLQLHLGVLLVVAGVLVGSERERA
jgi:hypothetical protein